MLVFIPKRRRKVLYSDLRPRLGEVFRRTGVAGEQGIEEGDLMPDHVHMMISISENLARPHRDDKNLDELNAWLLEKWFAYATSPSGTARLDDLNGRFSIASVARILERHRPSQRPVGDGIFHNSIFMDVDGIPLGANFVERPRDEVQSCDVLL